MRHRGGVPYQWRERRLLFGMAAGEGVAGRLGRTVRYGRCPRRERRTIEQLSVLLDVPAGTVLVRPGVPVPRFLVVLTGAASVLTDGQPTSALLAGDHFGEVSLLDGRPSPVAVVAETRMTLAAVAAADFATLLDRSPAVAQAVLHSLAGQVRARSAA